MSAMSMLFDLVPDIRLSFTCYNLDLALWIPRITKVLESPMMTPFGSFCLGRRPIGYAEKEARSLLVGPHSRARSRPCAPLSRVAQEVSKQ